LTVGLFLIVRLLNPARPGRVKQMPYESGMDPIHDARRRFDVRFHLVAIAFLVFDVELLFLYPWAVATRPAVPQPSEGKRGQSPFAGTRLRTNGDCPLFPGQAAPLGIDAAVSEGTVQSRDLVFGGAMVFIALLTLGFIYDWRKGIFRWR
jgi:NADH-quinone oxidoreductase subunit A